ncbi:NADH dehydrogenase subunit J [Frankia torreyi]|uniref:NADH-quinone oxidoreductase subunit J n=1 Tax=Frankia torreyi TaxID=1856 RepID=A0A0D8BG91_9ACTN|nr:MULTISPECIES: NADH-quinone oxidoreductase subunit J [Frankia]KJE23273.1 NADH dehydrogenase subunit J [Frankia torreyi]KQM06576.1 NADH dehydrogenase subunit J [Frankia sp. CpI1-P]
MTHATLLAAAGEITSTSTGEAAVFWILAPIAVLAAVGMVLVRSAVHAALLLVANLFCVAVFYLVQQAPFLGFVQIIVYAGAIMVLFLFVLMLVGVDSSDSLVETIRGQRLGAAIFGLGFAGLLVFPIGSAIDGGSAKGLDKANEGGNVQAIGRLLFSNYVFVFEAVSALLVVAAIGTMVLGHREREGGRVDQRERMRRRFAEPGRQVTPLPGPGVFARHDSADTLGLLPGGGRASGIGGIPGIPGGADEPGAADLPDGREAADAPDTPGSPGAPGVSDGPGSAGPGGPRGSGGPAGPGRPGGPGAGGGSTPGAPTPPAPTDGAAADGAAGGTDPVDVNGSALAGAGKGDER